MVRRFSLLPEAKRDVRRILIVFTILALILVCVVALAEMANTLSGCRGLPPYIQGIIVVIVAYFAYAMRDYGREMVDKYLKRR